MHEYIGRAAVVAQILDTRADALLIDAGLTEILETRESADKKVTGI